MYRYRTRDLAELGARLLAKGRRSQKRRLRRSIRIARHGHMLTVPMVVDPEHLYQCFLELKRDGGDAPGVDGVRLSDLANFDGRELADELHLAICQQEYRPSPRRPVKIPKHQGKGRRTLRVSTVKDRMLAKAVDACLTPTWDSQFHARSWGFRRGRNTWQMLAQIKADVESTGHTILAVADLENAFDNVPRGLLLGLHKPVVQERVERYFARNEMDRILTPRTAPLYAEAESEVDGLLQLVDWSLTANPPEAEQGIDQGSPYSPTALNVCLHFVHDEPIDRQQVLSAWYRYADNLVYLVEDLRTGEGVLQELADYFKEHGLKLKEDRETYDLADPRAAPDVLGFAVSLVDGSVEYCLGGKSWDSLESHLAACHESDNPPAEARAVLRGWLQANGPAFDDAGADAGRISRMARELGFRELATAREIRGWSRQAGDRWRATVAEATQVQAA